MFCLQCTNVIKHKYLSAAVIRKVTETFSHTLVVMLYSTFETPCRDATPAEFCQASASAVMICWICIITNVNVYWNVMPCSLVEVYRRYRGLYCPLLQGSAEYIDAYCNNYIYLCVVTSGAS